MEFAELARQEMPRLYALARQLVDDAAEDLVQECLLRPIAASPTCATPRRHRPG
jgi:DNA-directed RNA polymerase specialized sigma24 family protein